MSDGERAAEIAKEAHAGQVDKAGEPYINHPWRVASKLSGDEGIVALLHDVVEDSEWTLDRLRAEGFSETVLDAIDAVTRRKGEDYFDFIRRARDNEIGRVVKIHDLFDNLAPERLAKLSPADRAKAEHKYYEALSVLKIRDYQPRPL